MPKACYQVTSLLLFFSACAKSSGITEGARLVIPLPFAKLPSQYRKILVIISSLSFSPHSHTKVWLTLSNQWCKYLLWCVWIIVTLFLMQHSSCVQVSSSMYGSIAITGLNGGLCSWAGTCWLLWWMHDCSKRGLIAEILDKCRRALVWYLSILCLQVRVRMWAKLPCLFSERKWWQ